MAASSDNLPRDSLCLSPPHTVFVSLWIVYNWSTQVFDKKMVKDQKLSSGDLHETFIRVSSARKICVNRKNISFSKYSH